MTTLSRSAVACGAVVAPHAALRPRPVRVLQIGDGVFLRGFFDWMVDIANEKGASFDGIEKLGVRGALEERLWRENADRTGKFDGDAPLAFSRADLG